ncbi:hypothetical protein FGB62_5g141 [Gracilaria domingensis]|nr:hypothetical protein FGB62_5g141 [Gracilaria domingensis]
MLSHASATCGGTCAGCSSCGGGTRFAETALTSTAIARGTNLASVRRYLFLQDGNLASSVRAANGNRRSQGNGGGFRRARDNCAGGCRSMASGGSAIDTEGRKLLLIESHVGYLTLELMPEDTDGLVHKIVELAT